MPWVWRKSGEKLTKNQPPSRFFSFSRQFSLFFISLHRVFSRHNLRTTEQSQHKPLYKHISSLTTETITANLYFSFSTTNFFFFLHHRNPTTTSVLSCSTSTSIVLCKTSDDSRGPCARRAPSSLPPLICM